jgi:beta-lactamase superfamily II metal-dependent hydrolase
MSLVKSLSVGNGDMFYIRHNSDNFTIIDCSLSESNRNSILSQLRRAMAGKSVVRFISTHPDDDHLCGLEWLDDQLQFRNFYCVKNGATKDDPTDDFGRYCSLRNSPQKAFYISAGCRRHWMNLDGNGRGSAGLTVLWPKPDNPRFIEALEDAAWGLSPNNISAVIRYRLHGGPTILWMGDLETEFMEEIENDIDLSPADILFAPHHGRDSGRVPASILQRIQPKLIVVGEAPSEHLNYYADYDTITQNSAGDITFDCVTGWAHVYVSDVTYMPEFLEWQDLDDTHGYYIGSLRVGALD